MANAETGFSPSTLGFGETESQALQAVLTLSGRGLSASWSYQADFKQADVVLVFVDSPEGGRFWQGDLPNYPAQYFVAYSALKVIDAAWTSDTPPNNVPSRSALVELLNALVKQLSGLRTFPRKSEDMVSLIEALLAA